MKETTTMATMTRTRKAIEAMMAANYRQAGRENAYKVNFRQRFESDNLTARTETRGKWSAHFVLDGVPLYWLATVQKWGISLLDGLLTLKAWRLPRGDGSFQGPWSLDTYKATWLKQGRGLSIEAISGWIATAGHESGDVERTVCYHSTKSAEDARRGARRRLGYTD